MKINFIVLLLVELIICSEDIKAQNKPDDKQQYASIGNFILENGKQILDCQIGYRTFGKLNADRSNAILFLTWFSGTSKNLQDIAPGIVIDTSLYYLILMDALGDGYSSSPSNSSKQPRLQFPVFTIKDMVESQHKVLTEKMNITHLAAVLGISMGGMQAFQWIASYPDFMSKAIPIVGSPQLTSNDLLLWHAELSAMENDTAYQGGNYTHSPMLRAVSAIHQLASYTPTYQANHIARDSFDTWLSHIEAFHDFDWNNYRRQLEAMINHDIIKTTKGTLEGFAKGIKAKMLIVVSKQDQMVNPIPATQFATGANARILVLDDDCGHLATSCEGVQWVSAVRDFLKP